VRRQHQHRLAGSDQRPQPLFAVDRDQPRQAILTGPPEQAAFEHAATEHPEMRPGQLAPPGLVEFGETEAEIDQHDVPAPACEAEEGIPQRVAERRQQR
jgi:hypothetical protein